MQCCQVNSIPNGLSIGWKEGTEESAKIGVFRPGIDVVILGNLEASVAYSTLSLRGRYPLAVLQNVAPHASGRKDGHLFFLSSPRSNISSSFASCSIRIDGAPAKFWWQGCLEGCKRACRRFNQRLGRQSHNLRRVEAKDREPESCKISSSDFELYHWLQSRQDAYLIDVREPDEVAQGMIPSAVNIPLTVLGDALHMSPEDFSTKFGFKKPGIRQEVTFYCRSGKRSTSASDVAKRNGYTKCVFSSLQSVSNWRCISILNFKGSWLDWVERETKK